MNKFLCIIFCFNLIFGIFADCPGNFYEFRNNCYHYVKILVNHSEAIELCTLVNATLASINSKDEQNFIGSGVGDEWAWIGLEEHLVFKWEDGSDPNWFVTESTFQEKVTRCMQMWSNKNWNWVQHLDYMLSDCKVKSGGAICKKQSI